MSQPPDVTQLLISATDGNREAFEHLMPIVYDELHRIAHAHMRRERSGHTLNTTALVHEAYLKLVDLNRIRWQNRAHFFAMSSRTMRRILVNYAHQHRAQKRGGNLQKVTLDEALVASERWSGDVIALDEALTRLSKLNERHGKVVECRFFAGMNIEETAEALGVSVATVKRDWSLARAWLNRELTDAPPD
ncbi:MAG: sigma-70 family RNA polymerase sigma factor [Rhodothermia bacterium]|nr:sigma-70 family RNA polymerase sigma factor [Rhodothermia bacterium]